MSGGSYNYVFSRVREGADYTQDKEIKALIVDLADLLHDEEWFESGDYGKQEYVESLKAFKKKWLHQANTDNLKKYIVEELEEMKAKIEEML